VPFRALPPKARDPQAGHGLFFAFSEFPEKTLPMPSIRTRSTEEQRAHWRPLQMHQIDSDFMVIEKSQHNDSSISIDTNRHTQKNLL
jgi:hypothetical protein